MNTLAVATDRRVQCAMQIDTPIRLGDLTRAQLQVELKEHRSRAFMRWHSCYYEVGNPDGASRLFLDRYGDSWGATEVKASLMTLECKAGVVPGTTTDSAFAKPLVGIRALREGFADVARSESLLGRLPGVRVAAFNTKIPIQTTAASYAWVGEGIAMPVSALAYGDGGTLDVRKSGVIVAVTEELVKMAVPGADVAMRDDLVEGLRLYQDKALLDPASTAIAGIRPASITNGLTPVATSASFQADVQKLIDTFFAARPGARRSTVRLIANGQRAYQLATLYPNGAPIEVVDSEAAGNNLIILDTRALFVADGGIDLDVSRESSLQMNTTPDNPVTASTVQVSLWQHNMVGYKVRRMINWYAQPNSVQYMVTT